MPLLVDIDGAEGIFDLFPNVIEITSDLHPLKRQQTPAGPPSVIVIVRIEYTFFKACSQPEKPKISMRFELPEHWQVETWFDLRVAFYGDQLPIWADIRSWHDTFPTSPYVLPHVLATPIWRISIECDKPWQTFVDVLRLRQEAGFPGIAVYEIPSYIRPRELESLVHIGAEMESLGSDRNLTDFGLTLPDTFESSIWSKLPRLRHLDIRTVINYTSHGISAKLARDRLRDAVPTLAIREGCPAHPFTRLPARYTIETVPLLHLDTFTLRIQVDDNYFVTGLITTTAELLGVLPDPCHLANAFLNVGGPDCVYMVELETDPYDFGPETSSPPTQSLSMQVQKEIDSIIYQVHGKQAARGVGITFRSREKLRRRPGHREGGF
jgi:hypothetical protein